MAKMKRALEEVLNCSMCYGKGVIYYANGEDYDFEYCECNPYSLIIDEDGEIVNV